MSNYIQSVQEFHEIFNHPVNNYKEEIDLKLRQLRVKLIFEELQELADACDVRGTFGQLCEESISKSYDGNNVNKKEEIDALCDLQYVLSGAVLALGYQNIFDKSFDEVHRSNMSKMCKNLDEVNLTIESYKQKGMDSFYIEKDGGYIVLRKEDNKILKNINYSEANLNQFI